MARQASLPVWDRPASACLSSRIAYGLEVTPERLRIVEQDREDGTPRLVRDRNVDGPCAADQARNLTPRRRLPQSPFFT